MLICLIGPSCCGKSHFLKTLQSKLNFNVPIGITTRPKREEDNGLLEHMSEEKFLKFKESGKICFIAEMFDHHYAYRAFSKTGKFAIEVVRNNIEELKKIGGYAIKILPKNIEEGLKRIDLKRNHSVEERKQELQAEFYSTNNEMFDYVFRNGYDNESLKRFLNLVKNLN